MEYNINDLPENIKNRLRVLGSHWIWIGGTTDINRKDPKGKLRFDDKFEFAHRVIFHLLTGFDLDNGLQVNHSRDCQVSLCCNPNHLYAGTQQDNMNDRDALGNQWQSQKTHCPRGHEYSTSPTSGKRYCQTCKNARRDEWRQRKLHS